LVCAADRRYLEPLLVLMASITRSHSAEVVAALRMIVLHHDLPAGQITVIHQHADRMGLAVDVRQAPPAPETFPVTGWASKAVYLRLQIPDVIADERRVLYLDCDTVVRGDLRPLLSMPLSGAPLAAVRDPQNPVIGSGVALPVRPELGLVAGRDYFNSGVLLLDVDAARNSGLFERASWFLTRHPELARLWDQDALNFAADDRWLRLENRWNTFVFTALQQLPGFVHEMNGSRRPLDQLIAAEPAAAVLHFAGPVKPWQPEYPPGPARRLYRQLAATLAVAA
jgi:lipopolysaccharide biosynthesis glycosyltransferase